MRTIVVFALLFGAATALPLTGVTDTIGGTTFDDQNSGPALQWLATDPVNGIHAAWTFSTEPQSSGWPDRTVYYNFYDCATGEWTWIDPDDYMASGLNSQTQRTGYGTLELDPSGGAALVACHYNAGGMPPHFTPTVAWDLMPGAGIFDECVGAPGLVDYFLPVIGVTSDRTVHLLLIMFQASDNLYYTRSSSWCTWESPSGWQQTGAFGHNLIASGQSDRLLATWMTGSNESLCLSYRYSTDAGTTWTPAAQLVPPPVYGGETLTVCARGTSGLFDSGDDWAIATTLLPVVADSALDNPAELWLYQSGTSEWHRIHRAESHNLAGGFGLHAAICDRPSLGHNPDDGRFYVAWEQFDSTNLEPSTGLLRADIWASWSEDGATWRLPSRITVPDESSKRFPCLGRDCSGDWQAIGWVQDLIAGFNADEVGAESDNPVCVWHGDIVGIAENRSAPLARFDARPNPGRGFRFEGTAGRSNQPVRIYDVNGTLVRTLAAGAADGWDGRDDAGVRVRPGCYFARTGAPDSRPTKLVLVE